MSVSPRVKTAGVILIAVIGVVVWANYNKVDLSVSEEAMQHLRHKHAQESMADYLRSQIKLCYINSFKDCYKELNNFLLQQFDTPVILAALEETEEYPEVFSRCHELSHFLGRKSYEILKSVPASYSVSKDVCWGGYYHGVMEGYLQAQSLSWPELTDVKITESISEVCGKKEDYRLAHFHSECVHGLGHALMFVTESELPRSLKLCDTLPDSQNSATCYGGVFMENSSSSTNKDHPSKYTKADDPMYPCNALEERYLATCYQYQSSYFASLVNWDWARTAGLCLQVPSNYRSGCFTILGSNQVGNSLDKKEMLSNCNVATDISHRRECYNGILSGLAGRYIEDTSHLAEFCGLVAKSDSSHCWNEAIEKIKSWSADQTLRQRYCQALAKEENFYHTCLN